jgi:hypothetical protein
MASVLFNAAAMMKSPVDDVQRASTSSMSRTRVLKPFDPPHYTQCYLEDYQRIAAELRRRPVGRVQVGALVAIGTTWRPPIAVRMRHGESMWLQASSGTVPFELASAFPGSTKLTVAGGPTIIPHRGTPPKFILNLKSVLHSHGLLCCADKSEGKPINIASRWQMPTASASCEYLSSKGRRCVRRITSYPVHSGWRIRGELIVLPDTTNKNIAFVRHHYDNSSYRNICNGHDNCQYEFTSRST